MFDSLAPKSQIIVVIPPLNEGYGFKAGYIQALEYIKELSERYKKPVVVNISQGFNLGPHDGTSYFEKECDIFSNHGLTPGLVIVTSAGNERDKKRHAKLTIPPEQALAFITWQSNPYIRRYDRLELRFNSNNSLKFRLINPTGAEQSPVVTIYENPEISHTFKTGNLGLLTYRSFAEDNGDATLLITIFPNSNGKIELGAWKLEIERDQIDLPSQEIIHAWIEYISPGRRYILDEGEEERSIEFVDHVDENITLTIPGTAKHVISVGSVELTQPVSVASYSSLGPTRDKRQQPISVAPGQQIQAAMSNLETEIHNTLKSVGLGGTSYAAPYVTGAIALMLSARKKRCELDSNSIQLNACDITKIITKIAEKNGRSWNCEVGYGMLDLQELIRAATDY